MYLQGKQVFSFSMAQKFWTNVESVKPALKVHINTPELAKRHGPVLG